MKKFCLLLFFIGVLSFISTPEASAETLKVSSWEQNVRCQILAKWMPTDLQARQKLALQARISKEGILKAVSIKISSGDRLTDDLAVYQLKSAQPFAHFQGTQ